MVEKENNLYELKSVCPRRSTAIVKFENFVFRNPERLS